MRLPPAGTTTLVVDAASTLPASQRTGTAQAPYRALSEALQALHTGRLSQVHTVRVRAGTYAAATTQESFSLALSGLVGLTLQGEGPVVLDGGLTAAVFQATQSSNQQIPPPGRARPSRRLTCSPALQPWHLRRTAAWSWPATTATSTISIRAPAPRR